MHANGGNGTHYAYRTGFEIMDSCVCTTSDTGYKSFLVNHHYNIDRYRCLDVYVWLKDVIHFALCRIYHGDRALIRECYDLADKEALKLVKRGKIVA